MSGLGFVHEYRTIHSQVFLDGALVRLVECPAYAFRRLRERLHLGLHYRGPPCGPRRARSAPLLTSNANWSSSFPSHLE